MPGAWMVRAGEGGRMIQDFVRKGVIAIGWNALPDLSKIADRDTLRPLIDDKYADHKPGQRRSWMGQVGAFLFDMKPGDLAVSYDPDSRLYHLCTITGGYEFRKGLVPEYCHLHKVNWFGSVKRDDLTVRSRNTLGAIMAVFSLGEDVRKELMTLAEGKRPPTPIENEQDEIEQLRRDVISRSHEFIKDRLQKLDWDEMQELVAGLLRAMGYQTRVSPPGADRGKDIVASPDGLGLEQPRIRAEVKHRPNEAIGASDIRSFIGAMRQGDKGVYISTGGFTKEAHYEAERAQTPLTLLDLDDLVALVTQHYEKLDTETRALVPLVRVYWPAT